MRLHRQIEIRRIQLSIDLPVQSVFHTAMVRLHRDDAARFTIVDEKDRIDDVLDILRHVDPRIERLSLGFEGGQPTVKAKLAGMSLVPLPFVGQGMVRLFKIAVSIYATTGGVILVDEFENGLHHSSLRGVWRGFDYLCRNAGAQIIATTHSREAVVSAYEAFKDAPEFDLAVHRLERTKDGLDVVTLDKRKLERAIKKDTDMR